MTGDVVALTEATLDEVREALRGAAIAADGDSNDDEIAALQLCRDLLAEITGLPAFADEES